MDTADLLLAESKMGTPPGPSSFQTQQNLCAPSGCDDGDPCTTDRFDPATGDCLHVTDACDDGNRCTVDRCDPDAGCSHPLIECDDLDPCTADACNPGSGQCEFRAVADGAPCDCAWPSSL